MRIFRPVKWLQFAPAFALLAAGCMSESQKKIERLRANPAPSECAKHLSDSDPAVRLAATVTLETRCAASPAGVEGLIEAMADRHPMVRIAAIGAIKRLSPAAARPAVPYLIDRTADGSAEVRLAAIEALGRISGGESEVPALLGRIALDVEEYYPARIEAALALSLDSKKAGFAVAETALRLQNEFGKTDPVMSLCATFLSLRSSGDQDRLHRILTRQLSEGRAMEKSVSARMLGILGPSAKAAVPDLLKAVEDPDESVKASACAALGDLKSAPDQVIPVLLKVMSSETTLSLETSLAAARAAANFGGQAVAYLKKNVESLDSRDRFWAVFVLGEIGPAARTAAPAIRKLLQSPFEDQHVLWAAELAMDRIAKPGGNE